MQSFGRAVWDAGTQTFLFWDKSPGRLHVTFLSSGNGKKCWFNQSSSDKKYGKSSICSLNSKSIHFQQVAPRPFSFAGWALTVNMLGNSLYVHNMVWIENLLHTVICFMKRVSAGAQFCLIGNGCRSWRGRPTPCRPIFCRWQISACTSGLAVTAIPTTIVGFITFAKVMDGLTPCRVRRRWNSATNSDCAIGHEMLV